MHQLTENVIIKPVCTIGNKKADSKRSTIGFNVND